MKQKSLKSFSQLFLLLSLQTACANNTQEIHLKNPLSCLAPKVGINISDIYVDNHLNIFGDFRRFSDSFIQANVDQNADMRMTGSATMLGLIKLPSTALNLLANGLNLVIDPTTGNVGVGPSSTGLTTGGLIIFSSGNVISGASVLPTSPRLLGFGSSASETVNGSGQSILPSEAGGFSFPVPFNGTISNLQVSTDLYAISTTLLNLTGLQYNFTVFVSPSTPNNGTDHTTSSYVTTALTAATAFGSLADTTITVSTYRSSTNINTGSISVSAGDRVGVRVIMLTTGNTITDGLVAAQVGQISFAASLNYIPN